MPFTKRALFGLSFLALAACEAPETSAGDANAPSAVANSTPTPQVVRTEKPAGSDTSSNPTQVDMALLTKGIWFPEGVSCGTPTGDFWSFSSDELYSAPGSFGIFKLLDEGSKLQVKFDDEMSGKGTETLSIKRDEDNLIINGIEYHRCKDTRRKV
jgi:hypothetical protein